MKPHGKPVQCLITPLYFYYVHLNQLLVCTDCEPLTIWKIAGAVGWAFSAILIIVCITLTWFHCTSKCIQYNELDHLSKSSIFYAPDKRKTTISQSNHGESAKGMVSNAAYRAQSQQVRSVETTGHYEEVKLYAV